MAVLQNFEIRSNDWRVMKMMVLRGFVLARLLGSVLGEETSICPVLNQMMHPVLLKLLLVVHKKRIFMIARDQNND